MMRNVADGWHMALLGAAAVVAGCVGERPATTSHPRDVVGAHPHFAGIPNVAFSYYDVRGRSAEEIRRSMDAGRPRDSNDGQRVDALTEWTIKWSIPTNGRGRCDVDRVSLHYGARVVMPRLVGEEGLDEGLRQRWRAFVDALERHESWHARYAFDHMRDVRAAVRASKCDAAVQAAAQAVRAIGEVQLEYDRRTRHGAAEGIAFP